MSLKSRAALLFLLIFLAFTSRAQTPISIFVPNFSSSNQGGWQVNGDASFQGDPAYLQLTPDVWGQAGSAFWTNKVSLKNNFSFSVFFTFKLTPTYSQADGITFCIQQYSNTAGSAGGGLGYDGLPGNSIAIEYDTYQNDDPDNNHIALDINGQLHSAYDPTVAPSNALNGIYLADGQKKYSWIDYDGVNNVLEVRISNTSARPATPVLRVPNFNLSTILPDPNVYFGFTGATGAESEDQDILSVFATNTYAPFPSNPNSNSFLQGVANVNVNKSNDVSCDTQLSTLTVTATDQNGTPVPNTRVNLKVTSGTGTLASPNVTTGSDGTATVDISGIATGTATVTATEPLSGIYGTVDITNSGLTLAGDLNGCVGQTVQLTASDPNGAATPWTSSNTGVATVDADGLVTPVAAGSTLITFTNSGGCQVSATFKVGISVTGNLNICAGGSTQLEANGTPAAVNPWVSSLNDVTVDNNGFVQSSASSTGIATITYTNSNGCSVDVAVNVNPIPTDAAQFNVIQPDCSNAGKIVVTSPLSSNLLYSLDGIAFQADTTFANIPDGNYNVLIKTTAGCMGPASNATTITNNTGIGLYYSVVQPTCSTGEIDFYDFMYPNFVLDGPVFEFSIDGGATFQSDPHFLNLNPGNYTLLVKDPSGCLSTTTVVTLENPPSAVLMITNPAPVCSPAAVDLTASSVTRGSASQMQFEYYLDQEVTTPLSDPTQVSSSGTYYILGINSNGCYSIKPVDVVINQPVVGLHYSHSQYSYTPFVAISSLSPGVTSGTVSSYAVTPDLPVGLSLDATTGMISGTPTTVTAAQDYVITATNGCGGTSVTLNIEVASAAAPTNLTYSPSSNTFTKDVTITNLQPSVSGTVVSFSVLPALPAGLNLNTSTGEISGKPTVVIDPAITYAVTATNANGYVTCNLTIQVLAGPPPTYTWTGATSTDWSDNTNWDSNTVPTGIENVIIPNGTSNYPVGSDYTVSSGTTLKIESQASATFTGSLTSNSAGGVEIQGDANGTGSLIAATINGNGTIKVQRYLTTGRWHLVSSPTTQLASSFLTGNLNIATSGSNRGMMDYNPAANAWNPYFDNSNNSKLSAGYGYALRSVANGVVTFNGGGHAGNFTVGGLVANSWNCVGNPYTSAININSAANASNFLDDNTNNLDPSFAAIYVWEQPDSSNGQDGHYDIYSNSSGALTLQQEQAFMVRTNSTPSIQFNMTTQVHAATLTLKKSSTPWSNIQLKATVGSQSATTLIAFHEGMTTGLDVTYDAGLLRGNQQLNLFTRLVEGNGNRIPFAIQALPENQLNGVVIPVGLESKTGGEVIFSAETTNLSAGTKVILEDKQTALFTDLTMSNYKAAVAPNSVLNDRFQLYTATPVASTLGTQTLGEQTLMAYGVHNTEIRVIGAVDQGAQAALYDPNGRLLLSHRLNGGTLNVIPTPGYSSGIYFLTVKDQNRAQSFKVLLIP